jgi:hypothetical protein
MTQILAALGGISASAQVVAQLVQTIRRLQETGVKRLEDIAAGLGTQLEQLAGILQMLSVPGKLKLMTPEDGEKLAAVVINLQSELEELQKLVARVELSTRRGGKLIRRAKWALRGYEASLKLHLDRVESVKALLELSVTNPCIAEAPGT